jgi:hypothetical protein
VKSKLDEQTISITIQIVINLIRDVVNESNEMK